MMTHGIENPEEIQEKTALLPDYGFKNSDSTVFRSRAQCMDYAGRLYKYGVAAQTVSAPKEAHIGCGLCVRFDSAAFVRAQAVLRLGKYSAFKGFYKMEYRNGRPVVAPYSAVYGG